MARHYSIKDFFRQMPNALLARYFQGRELFGEIDFAAMKETKPCFGCRSLPGSEWIFWYGAGQQKTRIPW